MTKDDITKLIHEVADNNPLLGESELIEVISIEVFKRHIQEKLEYSTQINERMKELLSLLKKLQTELDKFRGGRNEK